MAISNRFNVLALLFLSCVATVPSHAQSLRERIQQFRAAHQAPSESDLDEDESAANATLPPGARLLPDIAYGSNRNQRMDVYLPAQANNAPVIFMVHGGGWRRGDKAAQTVVQNKMHRWVSRGFIFVSINYRMLPDTDVMTQAVDVKSALAAAQDKAPSWGGDPNKFIVIGHSAGAHLVALLSASPKSAYGGGVRPWLGTIALDSAAMNVVKIMEKRHMRLYDQPFGDDPAYWRKHADEARRMAERLDDTVVRQTLRDIATSYDELAKLAEERRAVEKPQ